MKRIFAVALGIFFVLSCVNVYAVQMAVVDVNKVASQYKGMEKALKKLDAQIKSESKRIVKAEKDFQVKYTDFDKQKSVLDKKIVEKKQEELTIQLRQIEQDKQQLLNTRESEKNKLYSSVMEEIKAVVQQIAKEKNYEIVLIKDLVLFGGEDITYLVLKKMNEE